MLLFARRHLRKGWKMRRGYEALSETRGFMKPTTLPAWIGLQDAPKRKTAADPDKADVIKKRLKRNDSSEFVLPKVKPSQTPKEKKLKMSEDQYNELRRIRGLATRLQRCTATFGTDKELNTVQVSERLNLSRMTALQLVKGWRDAGYIEQAFEVGKNVMKTWRIVASAAS